MVSLIILVVVVGFFWFKYVELNRENDSNNSYTGENFNISQNVTYSKEFCLAIITGNLTNYLKLYSEEEINSAEKNFFLYNAMNKYNYLSALFYRDKSFIQFEKNILKKELFSDLIDGKEVSIPSNLEEEKRLEMKQILIYNQAFLNLDLEKCLLLESGYDQNLCYQIIKGDCE